MYSERTQVLLSPDQRARLEAVARRRGVALGVVLREAVDAYIPVGSRPRDEALNALFDVDAPTADWDVMKAEIQRGALS
ncbi:MAG: hypothetical protein ABR564_04265 [Candidatus Dormibacteria bacterium]